MVILGKEIAHTQVLNRDHAWNVPGTAGKPVWLEQREQKEQRGGQSRNRDTQPRVTVRTLTFTLRQGAKEGAN